MDYPFNNASQIRNGKKLLPNAALQRSQKLNSVFKLYKPS